MQSRYGAFALFEKGVDVLSWQQIGGLDRASPAIKPCDFRPFMLERRILTQQIQIKRG